MRNVVLLFNVCIWLQLHSQAPLKVDVSSDIVIPKHYIVTICQEELTIDGLAEEACWQAARFSESFIDIEGEKEPTYDTKVKMLWDSTYLYVYAELEEPHIWGNLKQRDTVIFYNNDFEVFIDPSRNTYNYGEIEINALGTVWDLSLDKPYRTGGKANDHWNLNALTSAVHIYGSLNDPTDTDSMWTVEMAIPLEALTELNDGPNNIPREGEQWSINFSRVEWEHDLVKGTYRRKKVDGKFLPENNWVWSNQKVINMHEPEKWGTLQFTHQSSTDNVTLIRDENQAYKQVAYALFRKTAFGDLQHLLLQPRGGSQQLEITYGEENAIFAVFYKTLSGFEYSIQIPQTNSHLIIDQEGQLLIEEVKNFTFATWTGIGDIKTFDRDAWMEKLTSYKEIGISEVLVQADAEYLEQLVPLAQEKDIKIHAWMWTLNRPNDSIANKHPEWYAVNRKGDNSLEYRAYVDYYQWLSPFHPEAREYIKGNVRKLAKVEGLASVHLDYVRFVDVILGADLQPKYGLVQDHEMPEYDFGYHPIAREGFKKIFGKDPMEMEHPELSTEWRQYRLNAISSLVNELVDIAHEHGVKMSAAVFPFPEMSRQMVRQAWNDWDLDMAFPMVYQSFYRENVDWIGFAIEQGVKDVVFPIYAGLFMPALEDPKDLERAILLVKEKGANGVSLFTANNLNDEQKEVLKRLSGAKGD